jgi:hypothetical protein
MLGYLGIDRSYLFINTFVYTISDQYAEYAPVLFGGRLQWRNVLTYPMHALAQTTASPVVQHRHSVIDHVIESNRDSLKLVIAVGGAAQDSLATYIEAKGGECQAVVTDASKVQLVRYGAVNAGGNRKFYFPTDEDGRNLLVRPGERPDYADARVQDELKKRASDPEVMRSLVKLTDGKLGNGLHSLDQLTMDLYSCRVKGKGNTLNGLDGVTTEIRYIKVKHPGSNSPTLLGDFKNALATVKKWNGQGGWRLPPDAGMSQPFDDGFKYSHKPVPRRDFRFGLPEVIGLGTTNSTRRDGGAAIEFGSRDAGTYPRPEDAYTPDASYLNTDLGYEPPKTDFEAFDPGPGEKFAKAFTAVPAEALLKANKTADPRFGAGAIYRGRPATAKVVVLADQTSHDDMWAGRALMGLEGQKLQAFLGGIGAGLDYVILRTLPVDTLGADSATVAKLNGIAAEWRKDVFSKLVGNGSAKIILTLGRNADDVVKTLPTGGLPVVSLTAGYEQGFAKLKSAGWNARGMKLETAPVPIAREDIPYGMRRWTGTSGDRVVRSTGRFAGKLYKIVAPRWSTSQKPRPLTRQEASALREMGFQD